MDTRFQHLLLIAKIAGLATALLFSPVLRADDSGENTRISLADVNNEIFDLGIFVGVVNIEDFGSEIAPGISATFRASEDFFIQYNYLETDVSLSSYEKNQGQFFEGDDRRFRHYDLLVGYNLFQGEFFPSPPKANLSTFYLLAGVGETEFGGESSLTYTVGLGYQVALSRRIGFNLDFKDYIYQSTLVSDEKRSVHAAQFSTGLRYSF